MPTVGSSPRTRSTTRSRSPRERPVMNGPRPRLVVVHPWWDLWAHTAPPGFREARLDLARRVAEGFADAFDPIAVVEAGSIADGSRVGTELAARVVAEGPVDVVLVLQMMAVPVGYTLPILEALPGVPVVVW